MLGTEKVRVTVAIHQLFAVEEDEIDAAGRFDPAEMVSQFHEEGHAAGAVVGAEKRRLAGELRVRIAVGVRAGIVMTRQQHPLFRLGIPRDDHVTHPHGIARLGMRRVERLEFHLGFEL